MHGAAKTLHSQVRQQVVGHIVEQILSGEYESDFITLQDRSRDLLAEMDALAPLHATGKKDQEPVARQIELLTNVYLFDSIEQLDIDAVGDHPNRAADAQLIMPIPRKKTGARAEGACLARAKFLQEGT